jgi:hypothetical protein
MGQSFAIKSAAGGRRFQVGIRFGHLAKSRCQYWINQVGNSLSSSTLIQLKTFPDGPDRDDSTVNQYIDHFSNSFAKRRRIVFVQNQRFHGTGGILQDRTRITNLKEGPISMNILVSGRQRR